ncbi:MAG: hypothetical protein V7638_1050 [Acidobacteriota bacterium]
MEFLVTCFSVPALLQGSTKTFQGPASSLLEDRAVPDRFSQIASRIHEIPSELLQVSFKF